MQQQLPNHYGTMLAEGVKDVDQNLQQRESTFNFLLERGVPNEFATLLTTHKTHHIPSTEGGGPLTYHLVQIL